MDNIIDLIAQDSKASDISDQIKDVLFTKASEKIEAIRPDVAGSIFAEPETETETEQEVDQEPEQEQ
tara:strand:+ start:500 stop:700 length:201 start_codon:yes stop_codon:yes gene_type:complete